MTLKLKFSDTARPVAAYSRQRTPRDTLLLALDDQIALSEATIEGREFTVPKERYKTIDGVKKKVTVDSRPRAWWFEVAGKFFAEVRYGNAPVDLSGTDLTVFEVGKLEDIPKVFRQVREAIASGEYDDAIEAAKSKTTRRAA